jgi:hypothetical protein
MGLNCKPDQQAWICIPRTPVNEFMGIVQLHGHVVTTRRLVDVGAEPTPSWEVDPPQVCTVVGPVPLQFASNFWRGKLIRVAAIPDAYLRPFKDFPPEELRDLRDELQRELTS